MKKSSIQRKDASAAAGPQGLTRPAGPRAAAGLIVMSESDSTGPNAVAWQKKDAPRHKRSGATLQAANQALVDAQAVFARLRC